MPLDPFGPSGIASSSAPALRPAEVYLPGEMQDHYREHAAAMKAIPGRPSRLLTIAVDESPRILTEEVLKRLADVNDHSIGPDEPTRVTLIDEAQNVVDDGVSRFWLIAVILRQLPVEL